MGIYINPNEYQSGNVHRSPLYCSGLSEVKEGNVLFNDALNTFYLRLYGRKEMFYLTTHSTHFIYGYMEGRKCFI